MELKNRGSVETSTQAETSSKGRAQSKWEKGAHETIPPGVRWYDVDP